MKYVFPASAGLVATLAAGLILSPFVYFVFDKFLLHPSSGTILGITFILWMFFPSLSGGFLCSLAAESKEDFHIFLLVVIAFIASLLLSRGEIIKQGNTEFLNYGIFVTGYILGGISGVIYKKKNPKKSI